MVISTTIQKADCVAENSTSNAGLFASRLATSMVIFSNVIAEEDENGKNYTVDERMAEMRESLSAAAGSLTLSRKTFTTSFSKIFEMEERALVTF